MKKLIRSLAPDILIDLYRLYNAKKYGWFGDYKTWEEAENVSTGYDAIEIIQKVKESTLKVKNGKAITNVILLFLKKFNIHGQY